MSDSSLSRRLFILGNADKPELVGAIEEVREFAESHCTVVGTALGFDGQAALDAGADLMVVLGGDGTILAVSRSLGHRQIPLIGINFGKLGFIAEFTLAEFRKNFQTLLRDANYVSERMILDITVHRDGEVTFESIAVNDCVVRAGPPFRMIELTVSIDGNHLTTVAGDGFIVCTPVGSTAHNLSAGGPIIQGGVMGIALTPICPHSLSHQPLVVEHEATIEIAVTRPNEGASVMVDGQLGERLEPDDRITIRRFDTNMLLVRNPSYPKWHRLVTKLHWGIPPSYDE